MATHLVITHEISLKDGIGAREQAAVWSRIDAELKALEEAVKKEGGTTKTVTINRKGARAKPMTEHPAHRAAAE